MAAEREWFEKDFYKSLGVAETATDKEITRAYRKLAKELHPDTNPGKEEQFKEVSAAYDVLGDPAKRKEYDQVRKMGPAAGGFGGGARGGQPYGNVDFSDLGDMHDLGDIFGGLFGGPRRGRQQRGGDIETQFKISFRDAVMGLTTSIQLSGQGTPRTVNIRIPAGVVDKQRIRLKGKGFPGAGGGPAGDLYIEVHVLPDSRFTMKGRNITTTVSVPMIAALLGTTVQVPTLDGPVTLKVPGGTQPGTVMRVKGRGVPAGAKHAVGDLLVTVAVELPKKLSKKQRALVEELARELDEEVHHD
jgi:molecular chaperone DnaJ